MNERGDIDTTAGAAGTPGAAGTTQATPTTRGETAVSTDPTGGDTAGTETTNATSGITGSGTTTAPRGQNIAGTGAATAGTTETTDTGFLPADRMTDLRSRWDDIQAGFVDDPRTAVQNAQQLVGDLVTELTETFSRERGTLEGQWSSGGNADTEALRVALQRYRSFFNRLLNT